MMKRGVQGKIQCIFDTVVEELPSKKRPGQSFKVVATKELSQKAILSDLQLAIATEKLDGTCCFVQKYKGRLSLWARLDRKPNKKCDKRFKKFLAEKRQWRKNGSMVRFDFFWQKTFWVTGLFSKGEEPQFDWKYPEDLKEVPDSWIPALNVNTNSADGHPIADENGHIPGWVPISHDPRQYCWHHTVVDEENQLALLLRGSRNHKESGENYADELEIVVSPLNELDGMTLELIGTNINGNPYGLGSKLNPLHLLVIHGDIKAVNLPVPLNYEQIMNWFSGKDDKNVCGNVEGVVWHCKNNCMFKVHRHHLGLAWPLPKYESDSEISEAPLLCTRPVQINSHLLQEDASRLAFSGQFVIVKELHLQSYKSINRIPWNKS